MIDLRRALYSRCDHGTGRSPHVDAALQAVAASAIGAPFAETRLATYLQGVTTDLEEPYELRLHLWFDLPAGHPRFPAAARGLCCLVQPIDASGLYGPLLAGVGWLEAPIRLGRITSRDWVTEMIARDGFDAIPGAEWLAPTRDPLAEQVLAYYLARHLEGMINHTILEERLGLAPADDPWGDDDDEWDDDDPTDATDEAEPDDFC
jgi:hypothetical protein